MLVKVLLTSLKYKSCAFKLRCLKFGGTFYMRNCVTYTCGFGSSAIKLLKINYLKIMWLFVEPRNIFVKGIKNIKFVSKDSKQDT